MLEVGCGVGVFAVEVAARGEQFGCGNFPGAFVLFPVIPPLETAGEFLELDRLGFRIVFPPFRKWLFVVPNLFRWMGPVEEHEIRWNTRVGSEDAVGETNDGMEIEACEQFSLMRAQMPSPKRVPLGTTTAALPPVTLPSPCPLPEGEGDPGRRSLRMMSCRKSKAVSEVCLSSGKLLRMPRSSSPPNGGLVMMISTRSLSPISRNGKRRLLSGSILGDSKPCRTRFI
jgi:hypothetical protein